MSRKNVLFYASNWSYKGANNNSIEQSPSPEPKMTQLIKQLSAFSEL
jgi:hypothetical protein